MMSIISPWIFYLIDLFNKVGFLCQIIAIVLALVIITLFIFYMCQMEDIRHLSREQIEFAYKLPKKIKKLFIMLIICLGVIVGVPTKETMYTMLVADNVTYENLDKATNVIQDGVDYIFDKLDGEDE